MLNPSEADIFCPKNQLPAILVLADGSVYTGRSIGSEGMTVGEVVFNTAMTGYQEMLTDPSYCRQLITLTYPHIGNVGVNPNDAESAQIYAAGLIVRDLPRLASNWRMTQPLDAYLAERGVCAQTNTPPARYRCAKRLHFGWRGCKKPGRSCSGTSGSA